MEKATFAGGCFWCTEAIFKMLKGVKNVVSGYSGGYTDDPTYEKVSASTTGHAETIQITFDPKMITYDDLLYVFFRTHDPTTRNRQGMDVGPQYRSVIFYHTASQKKSAGRAKSEAEKILDKEVVTEILPFKKFFKAEESHQNFYKLHPDKPYCELVIDPKITKLKENFKDYLKGSYNSIQENSGLSARK